MNHNTFPIAIGVDIQNDFCPDGSLPVPSGDTIVAPFNKVAKATREAGGSVVYTRDWHPATTTHFDAWPVHCVAETTGAAFHPDLDVQTGDFVISKGTKVDEDAYSGFDALTPDGTSLEEIIEAKLQKYEKVVLRIGGLATDYCLQATVLDALALQERIGASRLAVIALEDCMKAVNIAEDDGKKAVANMKAHGAVFMDSTEVQL
jgi:nicotinamidase/pyrazinamidase